MIGVARGLVVGCGLALAMAGHASADDWPTAIGQPEGTQASQLTQITPENVGKLRPAWTYHTGEMPPAPGQSLEATPILADGKLFMCTGGGNTVALDPATGHELWRFTTPHPPGQDLHGPGMCRGVTYWQAAAPAPGTACEKRVFRGERGPDGARVFALDAETGKPCADFGAGAGHPGFIAMNDLEWGGPAATVFLSTPGIVHHDLYIMSEGILDNAAADQADGAVRAFDVRTGAQKWAFTTIPQALSAATGGANAWPHLTLDPVRGLVFVPTGSPSPDLYGAARTADIPLANAIVALRADTGEEVWHFQTIHHDLFDFDLPAQPMLTAITVDGKSRDVVVATAKTGFTFVLDRETGTPVFPIPEVPAPKSDIPGETSSPTQPAPSLPEPFARQTLTRDDLFGLTPIDRAACRKLFDESRYAGLFTPPSTTPTIMFPSLLGGGNWGGAAVAPGSNLMIVKASNLATRAQLVERSKNAPPPHRAPTWMDAPMNGTPYRMEGEVFTSPLGIPCTPPPWGTLTAIDLGTGKIAWQIPLGQSKRWGITAPAFLHWGSPNVGGPLVTASGLVFIGATLDAKFRAFDVKSGRELWQTSLPAPGMAVPMTYMAGGKQFVVISAGGNSLAETELSDAVIAFTLP